jgi:hypothetical protein
LGILNREKGRLIMRLSVMSPKKKNLLSKKVSSLCGST